uniref:ATP-binding protein n=1 Tax=Rhizobium sp. TaxID=391 RepID=UPI0028AD2127
QLYLALRLAGYEEFAAVRPAVPFVADDIMESFDNPRSEEVFRLLGQMAKVGQVIYLTHHLHLCEIAKSVVPHVKIHQLG